MKTFLCGTLWWMAVTGAVTAAIGETLAQCEMRYGPVRATRARDDPRGISKVYCFETREAEITVRFMEGKAAWVRYTITALYDEKQFQQLLAINAAGGTWHLTRDTQETEAEKELFEKVWQYDNDDKSLQAVLGHHDFGMTTASFYTAKVGKLLGMYR